MDEQNMDIMWKSDPDELDFPWGKNCFAFFV